jgi:hypothetical protein
MALDSSHDDGADKPDVKPEQHLRPSGSGGDAATLRAEPAEQRSHAEYYEALRAADGGPADPDDGQPAAADTRTEGSGWDAVDEQERPSLDAVRVSPERTTHILDGDSHGGGHRHGVGKPGKTEFPASWDDKKIIDTAVDVGSKPDKPPTHQDGNDTWLCAGTRDDVEVSVVIMRSGEILTSWPEEGGPGVVRNPKKGTS